MKLWDLDVDERIGYLQALADAKATYMSRRVFDPALQLEVRRFYPVLAGRIVLEPSIASNQYESSSAKAIAVAQRVKIWASREIDRLKHSGKPRK